MKHKEKTLKIKEIKGKGGVYRTVRGRRRKGKRRGVERKGTGT